MKLIFVDIDGVINGSDFFKKRHQFRKENNLKVEQFPDHVDPATIKRLTRIIEETGAKIVISSTWRKLYSLEELQKGLDGEGLRGEIIGLTPIFESPDMPEGYERQRMVFRGTEIFAYISKHFPKWYLKKDYVIIDDDSDMLYWQKDNFVNTDREIGLTDKDAELAIEILNK